MRKCKVDDRSETLELIRMTRMKAYLCKHSDRRSLGALELRGSISIFVDWVSNLRSQAKDIVQDELLMCPMLWCREKFARADLTINHVKACPYLENAWYWCSSCSRPERYLLCDKACDAKERPRMIPKKSRLVKAVSYFNILGRRRLLKMSTG